ncbi:MAG: thiolase family protein [Alicyclobacillaceae bacterium]|nr:thiolase family protein [Alicyclobacillaceae bacterium]
MREAVVVSAVRTPIGKRNGYFSQVTPDVLGAHVLKAAVDRAGIDPAMVDDIIFGCVTQTGEQGGNIGRLAGLLAGFPDSVPAVSLNRMCGSSQQAIHFAAQAILSGDMDIVIAGGVESMTRVPMGSDWSGPTPAMAEKYDLVHQGISAELIAEKWGLSREELDAYSLKSHQRAVAAREQGWFDEEIVPVEVQGDQGPVVIRHDEGPRPDTSLEKMATLKPAFREDGVVTAGNASQISDGAAAVVIMEAGKAKALGIKPLARIVARAVVGVDPVLMLHGIIPATRKVLEKAGLRLEDIDLFEVNEAFASVVLAWFREIEADPEKVNVKGGAIALGHPLGASGARIAATLIHELRRRGGRYGLHTMCIGHGMATATIYERWED